MPQSLPLIDRRGDAGAAGDGGLGRGARGAERASGDDAKPRVAARQRLWVAAIAKKDRVPKAPARQLRRRWTGWGRELDGSLEAMPRGSAGGGRRSTTHDG